MTGHADRSLVAAGKRFLSANRLDAAAALTYYSVLSMFPAILVGTSLIGLLDPGATSALLEGIEGVTPEDGYRIIEAAVEGLQTNPATAGVMALIGLAAALWAASNYVAAFSRAMNAVFRVAEERPWWMVLVVRVVLTLVVGALTAFAAFAAATGGTVAASVGGAFGVPGAAVTVWEWAKWPLVLLVVAFIVALLYWLAPARTDPFRRRVPGAALAVVLWVVASAGFGLALSRSELRGLMAHTGGNPLFVDVTLRVRDAGPIGYRIQPLAADDVANFGVDDLDRGHAFPSVIIFQRGVNYARVRWA
jgi:membrane protein